MARRIRNKKTNLKDVILTELYSFAPWRLRGKSLIRPIQFVDEPFQFDQTLAIGDFIHPSREIKAKGGEDRQHYCKDDINDFLFEKSVKVIRR